VEGKGRHVDTLFGKKSSHDQKSVGGKNPWLNANVVETGKNQ